MTDDPKPNPAVCSRLRSKGTPGQRYADVVTFEDGYTSSATFWCVMTGEAVGQDDYLVHPHACGQGRVCFTPPKQPGNANADHSS